MKHHRTQWLALLLAILLLLSGPFALAEPLPEELPELDLAEATGATPALLDGEAPFETPAEEAPAEEAPALNALVIGETQAIETGVWQAVNLRRAEGFTGAFARVSGTLTLVDAQIEGVPARQADLAQAFALLPGGGIAISDGAPLSISLAALCLNKSATRQLKLTAGGASLAAKKATWRSSNSKVVSVSSAGKLKAVKVGSATITATYGDASAACRVTVVAPVTKVKLNKSSATVAQGGALQLKATLTPANAYDQTLAWSSSNEKVAAVDENGLVTGLAKGSATITAKSSSGKTAKCKVTVKVVTPKTLDFKKLYVTLHPGESYETRVTLTPDSVTDPRVIYSSSDPAVATVDEAGVVTAVAAGSATITAVSAATAKVKNTCRVGVVEPGSARLSGLIIGINPGHQSTTIKKQYPLAPGSKKTAYGVKVGACGKYTRVNEYETTLAIGLKLMRILTEQGATVVITRTTNDVMLTNIDRAKMLNNAGVEIALQLHCNSVKSSTKEGLSGYIRTTGDWVEESRAMSKALCAEMSAATGAVNLGVKVYNDYMSLNWTTTPSVLLEMGYLSNKKEDYLLASDDYRELMALGISEGLCRYFGR